MHHRTVTLVFGALLLIAGGAVVAPWILADDEAPILRWNTTDETEVPQEPGEIEVANGQEVGDGRTAIELDGIGGAADERVDVVLRGRVVDKFRGPVAAATVWLDFGRGGPRGGGQGNRQRRVPDPVTTDAEGRFAFQGQTFRNLRVWLQVAHQQHAVGVFDRDVGSVATAVDLGDLMLMAGGEVRGRVTDLEGNGIAGADLRLQPDNGNTLRQLRDREKLLPPFTTDTNGYYRRPHLAAGDWSLTATAKRHTEGRSGTFAVEEDQAAEVEDIRLGPGFEATGIVRNRDGQPIAKAAVSMQSEPRPRGGNDGQEGAPGATGRPGPGGRGGPAAWAGGREHRTTTDDQGRFFLEHLPGVAMRLDVDADGYLDYRQNAIDPTLGQLLQVTMQDGLRIEGRVLDGDGTPVTLFAVRAVRLRGLPASGQGNVDVNAVMNQLRQGNLDETTRATIRAQFEGQAGNLREMFGREGGRENRGPVGPGGPDGGRQNLRDLGKAERHADGRFVATGLQEGVFEVHVQSPDHARYRSAEVELRNGGSPPVLEVVLDGGVYLAGVVLDDAGNPVVGAQVELRAPSALEGLGRRGGRGGRPGGDGSGGAGTTPDLNSITREFARMAAAAMPGLEVRTDREGLFVFKHATRGTWRVHAEARGHAPGSTDTFELTADRSGVEIHLAALGSIQGVVAGLRDNEHGEARVAAVPFASNTGSDGAAAPFGGLGALFGRGRGGGGGGGGPFQSVGVEPDGSYRIPDLAPGEYLVRAWIGSPQDLMRELAPRFADGTLRADVAVRASETSKLDLSITRAVVGSVAGSVLHNQAAGAGMQVELQRNDENGTSGGPRGGDRGRGMGGGLPGFGRTFQATVAASGRFTIADVPPGLYRLRVQNARRGGTLHEELLQVAADVVNERTIVIQTHSLRGRITRDDGGDSAELGGRISLLPGLTELPPNLGEWQRTNPGLDARLQNGAFTFDAVKPGGYLLVATVRGRERTHQAIVVQGDQEISVAVGKPAAPRTTPAPGTAPQPAGR